ncbi:MAG: cyclic pyranopterin monophosphate synthase MoaC [Candidatus Methanoperedens sp.]|nr:cyclic pyranopterin monophosphate synthase MoaC [Candidatus Methanoperedens sp.]MCZ7369962.1 cyclic pyranopterin monophosphate synthase MoaC [Candidatus Methanoperedens sp.]
MMFSHIQDGRARMVDISDKQDVARRAVASGEIKLKPETLAAIENRRIEKGEVLETARIAAIMAVKQTPLMIPMCHQIPITSIDVRFETFESTIKAIVEVKSTGKTGVEMEALNGVSTALLTIWDMVKSAEKDETGNYPVTAIKNIMVLEKSKSDPHSKH